MTATNDNNSNQPLASLREIQELSIAITAKSLNPAMLTVDFLKYSGIVPPDWELNGQPVLNPNYAQVNFQNGISIVAQPRKITFVEIINSPDSLNLKLPEIVGLYLDKLPLAEYQALGIAPKSIVPLPSSPDAAKKYITETLLAPGPWHNFGTAPLQAGINLLYQLETSQGLPKNKLFILKNNNHSRSVGGRDRWLPPPSNFVVELILYIINQVFLFKNIWN